MLLHASVYNKQLGETRLCNRLKTSHFHAHDVRLSLLWCALQEHRSSRRTNARYTSRRTAPRVNAFTATNLKLWLLNNGNTTREISLLVPCCILLGWRDRQGPWVRRRRLDRMPQRWRRILVDGPTAKRSKNDGPLSIEFCCRPRRKLHSRQPIGQSNASSREGR